MVRPRPLRYRQAVIRTLKDAVRSVVHGEIVMWPAVLAGLAAAVISYCVGSVHLNLSVEVALASMTTFLFGVLLAFTIARTRERLTTVRELMARGNSSLQSIHQMMAVFPEPDRSRIRGLVDAQLTARSTTGWPTTTCRRPRTRHWSTPCTPSNRPPARKR